MFLARNISLHLHYQILICRFKSQRLFGIVQVCMLKMWLYLLLFLITFKSWRNVKTYLKLCVFSHSNIRHVPTIQRTWVLMYLLYFLTSLFYFVIFVPLVMEVVMSRLFFHSCYSSSSKLVNISDMLYNCTL